jgi:hypothetical protein
MPESMSDVSVGTIPRIYTNQQVIDSFFYAANKINANDVSGDDYQALLARAGLDLNQLAADRNGHYSGPEVAQLVTLSATERAFVQEGLLQQLRRTGRPGQVNAADGLNLRAGPGLEHALIVSLPLGTVVNILSEEGDWLYVIAGEQSGWLFAPLVSPLAGNGQSGSVAIFPSGGSSATTPLTPASPLALPANATSHMAAAATTWNQYGGLILAECTRLAIDPAVAVAILGVESAGRAFEGERMVIRFENHIFLHYWGQEHREIFDRHFTGSSDGSQHRWSPDGGGSWLPCHTNQATEWQVFELARAFDQSAAMYSISMGAAQIMGFNHTSIGYRTVQEMFEAFQADVRNQITALFRFIEVNHLEDAVRRADFRAFARVYNGRGQEEMYGERMQSYYDAYRQLLDPASRGRATAVSRLPQPGVPTRFQADPELLAIWHKYVAGAFANNDTMFESILQGFMRPYWSTIWMYRILFALGVISFVLAAALAIFTDRTTSIFTFGGLSAVAILGYFFNRPLQALEQNLQFFTWLGIIYNNYWTRLTLLNDEATVQNDITEVTDETIVRLNELIQEHRLRSGARQRLNLP